MILHELINGCIKGDSICQRELYDQYYSYSLKTIRAYGNNFEDSREILNDAFIKVFESIKNYNPDQAFLPWFRSILVRTIINHYHKNKNKMSFTELSLDILDQNFIIIPDIILQMEVEELLALTASLPPAYRLVLNLYALEGHTHDEIAKMLRINVGTSKSNLFKARVFLAKLIAKSK